MFLDQSIKEKEKNKKKLDKNIPAEEIYASI